MMRSKILWLSAAICLATHGALAQTMPADDGPAGVSLQRDETRDDSELPYRRAHLTVQFDSSAEHNVIRGISVRSTRGGPTMLLPVTIAAGAPRRAFEVLLPALSIEDSYRVRLLAAETAGSAVIAEFDLSLDWPAEWVTAQAFLAPEAYDEGDYLPPVWSNRTRQNVFVIAAGACILLAASLFVRRGKWRAPLATVTVIAAGAALWLAASSEPIVVQRQVGENGNLLLVTALRDTRCDISEPHMMPLYYNLEEMARDDAVIRTPGRLIVDLKGGEVRLFARRPVGGD